MKRLTELAVYRHRMLLTQRLKTRESNIDNGSQSGIRILRTSYLTKSPTMSGSPPGFIEDLSRFYRVHCQRHGRYHSSDNHIRGKIWLHDCLNSNDFIPRL